MIKNNFVVFSVLEKSLGGGWKLDKNGSHFKTEELSQG